MLFTDGPDNRKNPAENIYISLINSAKDYVYIYTPYFVPSPEIITAILNASRSGVDIRIITPHKPDKWYVHLTTRSYYKTLIKSGVKVYAASEKAYENYTSIKYEGPVAIVMGAEDTGVSMDNLRICDSMVKIPQFGTIGSLNVSVASSILIYEVVRQRMQELPPM
jgi:phosphatidylserine/phosphatidylglycerophosphate/cardiolipin synthase-like enzyme